MLHRIAHWLGWNRGRVVSWTDEGRTRVGFMCAGCGRTSGIEDATDLYELFAAARGAADESAHNDEMKGGSRG